MVDVADECCRDWHQWTNHSSYVLDPEEAFTGQVYPLGIDPIWALSTNRLGFLNSFKMKLSVILGIGQMTFGLVLSVVNFRYFHKRIDIIHVFLPQLIFLSLLFIYLCALIIFKWIAIGVQAVDMPVGHYPSSHCAPSLLIGFINMFMLKPRLDGFINTNITGNVEHCRDSTHVNHLQCTEWPSCNLTAFYPGQVIVEKVFVIIAALCVPWMLLAKPLILKARAKKAAEAKAAVIAMSFSTEHDTVTLEMRGNDEDHAANGGEKKKAEAAAVKKKDSHSGSGGRHDGHGVCF